MAVTSRCATIRDFEDTVPPVVTVKPRRTVNVSALRRLRRRRHR